MSCSTAHLIEMTNQDLKFDTVIIGMGNTGLSCARYLANRKIDFAMTDSRENPPMLNAIREQFPHITLSTGRFDPALLNNAKQLLISPGISLKEPEIAAAINSGVSVCGDIEIFCQQVKAPVVAITGSNGKSTVTTLVAEMTKDAGIKTGVGGNLGTPVLELLSENDTEIFVLELSSFQLETVSSLNAVASVVLNLSEDHMDRYSGMKDYAQAKARIYEGNGTMIINLDDPLVAAMCRPGRNISAFTLSEPDKNNYGVRDYSGVRWLVKGGEKLIRAEEIRIAGEHNIANSLAAFAIAEVLQIPRTNICSVLRKFTGLPHRCQWVADVNGVRWFNDSKGTNVGASYAAIKGLADNKNIVLIAGGDGKGANFSRLAEAAKNYLRAAVLIGRDAPRIKQVLQGVVPVIDAIDMNAAVQTAATLASQGDIVLLSPACASFDMFNDYRARGEEFKNSVERLVNK